MKRKLFAGSISTVCALALLAACCGAPRRAGRGALFPEFRLEFLADHNVPTGEPFGGVDPEKFGGLSSLAFEPSSGIFLALSDAKSDFRLYRLEIAAAPGRLNVRPAGVLFLRDSDGGAFPASALDPEGLALVPDGTMFISSERHGYGVTSPGLFLFGAGGKLLRTLPVPDKYLPPDEGEGLRGTRPNASFEALTLAPDETSLFTASENALYQDGDLSTPEVGSLVRILEIILAGVEPVPGAEFAYPLEAISVPDGARPGRGDNGLVELLALGGREFLSLERSFFIEDEGAVPRRSRTRIRIFRFSLEGADDIAPLPSLRGAKAARPVRKTLILDLDGIIGRLSPGFRILDNFEAMCFGPTLGNGRRTLLLMSDNNFSAIQRTAFFAFEVVPR